MSGGDIGNKTFTTVQACKEYCAMTEGCVAFVTTAGTENRCWLKNKQHGIEVANPIGISVRMNCDAEGKPMSPIYFICALHPTPEGQNILILSRHAGTEFQNDHECEARGIHFSLGPSA